MILKQFMDMYDNWNGKTKINDDNLDTIIEGKIIDIMDCVAQFHPLTEVENYEKLFTMKVVAFGFYDEELCVRVA